MAIIGVASIRVKPDLSQFRKELTAELKTIKTDFTINVQAEVDTTRVREELNRVIRTYDGKNINLQTKLDRPALARVKAALASLGRGGAAFLGLAGATGLSATVQLSKLALVAGALASTLTGLVTIVGGLGQALVSVGVAAGAVAVGGLASLVAIIGTVKFATKGMGDAFKAIGEGDAQKLNEALKGMSPAARDFVKSLASIHPQLETLRKQIQSNLFQGLGPDAKKAASGVLKEFGGMGLQIANTLNGVGKDLFKFFQDPATLGSLRSIGDNIAGGFRAASGAIKPIVSAIIDIVKSATELLPKLGTGITNVATKFSNFIHQKAASGELTKFFQEGIDKAKQFGRILRDFGVGIASIFRLASGGTGGFLNTLENVAQKFRDFTTSFKGQDQISTFFQVIRELSGSFGVFLKALQPLLPLIGEFAKLLAGTLGKILEALGPIIMDLAKTALETLKDILPKITPFIIKFADAIGKILEAAIPLAKPLTDILVALTPLIDPLVKLAQTIFPALAKILVAIAPLIEALAKVLGALIGVVTVLADGFIHLGDTIGTAFSDPGQLVRNMLQLLNGEVKSQIPRLGDTLRNAIDVAFASIGNTPASAQAAQDVMKRFADGIQNMFPTLSGALNQITDLIRAALGQPPRDQAKQDGAAISNALGDGIVSQQEQVARQAAAVIDRVFVLLGLKQPAFEEQGKKIADSLSGGISSGANNAKNSAQRVGDAVSGALNGINLAPQGNAAINSFIAGIQARVDAIRKVLASVTSLIPVWKGPMSLDRKLLTPSGIAIMDGLERGLRAGIPGVRGILTDTTGLIESSFSSSDLQQNVQASAAVAMNGIEPSPVNINIDLNRELLQNFVQTEISESNRNVRRKVTGGVNP